MNSAAAKNNELGRVTLVLGSIAPKVSRDSRLILVRFKLMRVRLVYVKEDVPILNVCVAPCLCCGV